MPVQEIVLDCCCNGSEEHLALGHLTQAIAKIFAGVIDFNGALLPPLQKSLFEGRNFWSDVAWPEIESHFLQMTQIMPGNVLSIEYDVPNGRRWAHHVADTEFMEAWLKHPYFHMIK